MSSDIEIPIDQVDALLSAHRGVLDLDDDIRDDGLVLRRRWAPDRTVQAVDEDLCSAGYSLLFPGDGRMLVGTGRSRNVEFRKRSS